MRIPLTRTLESASQPQRAAGASMEHFVAFARRDRARRLARIGVVSTLILALALAGWWWKPTLTRDVADPTPTVAASGDATPEPLPRAAVPGRWGDHRVALTVAEVAGRCSDRPAGSTLDDYPYAVGGLAMVKLVDGRYTTCAYGIDQAGDPVYYTTFGPDVATDQGAIEACTRHLGYDFSGWTVIGHSDLDLGWDPLAGDFDRTSTLRLIGLVSEDRHVADCNLPYPGRGYGSVRNMDEFVAPGVTASLGLARVPAGTGLGRVIGLTVEGIGVVLDEAGRPDTRAARVEAHFDDTDAVLTLPVHDGWIVSQERIDFPAVREDANFDPNWLVYDATGVLIGNYGH